MIYRAAASRLPAFLRRYLLHFESSIEDAVAQFARRLPAGSRVLDAGAGEGQYAHFFEKQRYLGVDLGIGDAAWNYSGLDCVANLEALPLHDSSFDAALNVVTLEHVERPDRVLAEIARVLKPGGTLLLVAPHEWEEHQQPHDYFRYTRYGLAMLLRRAGFDEIKTEPVGGFFRLLSRRLLNALQFFPGPLFFVAALFFAPPALILPLFDSLDRERHFTLGYICHARKSAA
jgi:SAM-dependent methyltransferase